MSNLPLDHLAFRVPDRDSAKALLGFFGYAMQRSFKIQFDDGSEADCYAMTHPTNIDIFVSSGEQGSLISEWVKDHGGKGAIHHLAFAVDDVAAEMDRWRKRGIKFQRDEPLVCSCERPITQVFTKPTPETGIIYELIHRNGHPGFCEENVKRLMETSNIGADQ